SRCCIATRWRLQCICHARQRSFGGSAKCARADCNEYGNQADHECVLYSRGALFIPEENSASQIDSARMGKMNPTQHIANIHEAAPADQKERLVNRVSRGCTRAGFSG